MAERKPRESGESKAAHTCAVCGKPVEDGAQHFPFCSERCRLVDLGKWFKGDYKVSRPLDERDLDEES